MQLAAPVRPIFGALLHERLLLVHDALERRGKENAQVKHERPVLDVVQVVLHAGLDGGVAAQAVDLRPARHAGAHLVAQHVQRHAALEVVHMLGKLGPRAHKAHVTPEHVEQLGQLVDGVTAHKGAEGRTARVAGDSPAVRLMHVYAHRTKLVHVERLAVASHALLLE